MDIVNAFEYIDDKNRERMENVKDKLINSRTILDEIKSMLLIVKNKIID